MTDASDRVEPVAGLPTESKIFLATGLFAATIGIIYGLTSGGEWAGTVGLGAAAVFGLAMAFFMNRDIRAVQDSVIAAENAQAAGETNGEPGPLFLPHSSIWPLGIGAGAALVFAGLAFGFWFIIPGLALFFHSIIGFASQSRRRSLC